MISFLKNKLTGKRVLILGFGQEGISTYKVLVENIEGLHIGIADRDEQIMENELLREFDISELHCGENYLNSLINYDFVIKSPGVSLSGIEIPSSVEMSSQTSMFIEFYRQQIIGVTGTKGKSTTCSLIHFLLDKCNLKNVLIGNIGKPAFDSIAEIDSETIIVFELSAHQLENITSSPHISVLLNLFPEHLDYFNSFEKYSEAKLNIVKFQRENDEFIFSEQFKDADLIVGGRHCFGESKTCEAQRTKEGIWFNQDGEDLFLSVENVSLTGFHNLMNVMAAMLAVKQCNVELRNVINYIGDFKGLSHRLEFIGIHGGIKFYNDSISTIPQSTIAAVKTLESVDTLILGGYDRGLDYSILTNFLVDSKIRNYIFLGKAGEIMYAQLKHKLELKKGLWKVKDLENAFEIIKQHTIKGGSCLLSPAAASYDQFRNFEHRGDLYSTLAKAIV